MKRLIILFAVTLFSVICYATPSQVFLSGCDGVDQSTTNTQALEFATTNGSQTAAQMSAVLTFRKSASNGGDNSSRRSCKVNVTTGNHAGYKMKTDFTPTSSMNHKFSYVYDTLPSAGNSRALSCIFESDGSPGCCVTLDSNGKLGLIYSEGTSWGVQANAMVRNRCSVHEELGCSTSNDCPDHATGETCTTCSTASNLDNCHLTDIEYHEEVRGTDQVLCEMALDGTWVYQGTTKFVNHSPVNSPVNAGFGAMNVTNFTTGSLLGYYDDLAWIDSSKGDTIGPGYVIRLIPASVGKGTALQWDRDTCPGANAVDCLTDYDDSSNFTYNSDNTNDQLFTNKKNYIESFSALAPIPSSLQEGASITMGDIALFGRTTSNAGTREFQLSFQYCPVSTCISNVCSNNNKACLTSLDCCETPVSSGALTQNNDTTIRQLGRFGLANPPTSNWDTFLKGAALAFNTTVNTAAEQIRVGAVIEYLYAKMPSAQEDATFKDGNIGTDDGIFSVGMAGNSTCAGSFESGCVGGSNNGAACTQATCCSWDFDGADCATPGSCFCDAPTGGCGDPGSTIANAKCRSCPTHRELFNNGFGLPCTINSDCALTCNTTTHKCQQANGDDISTLSCNSNPDCDLGACPSAGSATCVESCPNGGYCASSTSSGYPGGAKGKIPVDSGSTKGVIYRCCQGGESSAGFYQNHFYDFLNGKQNISAAGGCSAVVGTGKCICTSDNDCDGSANSCNLTTGTCQTGSRAACQTAADCNNKPCKFPPCDICIFMESYNDQHPMGFNLNLETNSRGNTDPNCEDSSGVQLPNPTSTQYPDLCPNVGTGTYTCPSTQCTQKSDCSSLSSNSQCYGATTTSGAACMRKFPSTETCTSQIVNGCYTDNDCNGAAGVTMTCSKTTAISSTSNLSVTGICLCDSDTDCQNAYGSSYVCNDSICRLSCSGTSDTSCGPSSSCVDVDPGAGTKYVCKGICSCTCDSISCGDDSQCGKRDYQAALAPFRKRTFTGICNKSSGKCNNCGLVRSGDPGVLKGPCECTSDPDCTGTCNTAIGFCTNGDAPCTIDGDCAGTCNTTTKRCSTGAGSSCKSDSQCAPGKHCLSLHRNYAQYEGGHMGIYAFVAKQMQNYVDSLVESDRKPILMFMTVPLPGGKLSASSTKCPGTTKTGFCETASGYLAFSDLEYFTRSYTDLIALFPARYVIDVREYFDKIRYSNVFHFSDQVHYGAEGSSAVGDGIAFYVNNLNVCLTPSGTPQKYCRHQDKSFTSTGCVADSDCGALERCVRRRCDGDEANCPCNAASGGCTVDTCGPT